MRLYHYTSLAILPAILRDGLTKGDVPLDAYQSINAVCLTIRDAPPRRVLVNGQNGSFDKTGMRIAVEVNHTDPLLVRWEHFPQQFRVDARFFRRLNAVSGVNAVRDWYIYLGKIPSEWFTEIFSMVDGFPVRREVLEEIMWRPVPRQVSAVPVKLVTVTEAKKSKQQAA